MNTVHPGDWRRPWTDAVETIRRQYGDQIGRPTGELITPALVLDADVADRNIETMSTTLAGGHVGLRPHTKVHKSPDLAKWQIAAGAVGVTVASVWEAAAMGSAGVSDVLIANEVVGPAKVGAAARLARHIRLEIVVDDVTNIADFSAAAAAAGSTVDVLVDLDVGMARCGARSPQEALALARAVDAAPHLRLRGVQAYEGHCMLEPDLTQRILKANEAMDYAGMVKTLLSDDGLDVPVLSGGGTGTYNVTGMHPSVTELQAGSYVFMDAFHGSLVPGFEVSLTVHSTVVARHGDTVVLDAGRKSVGIDFVLPPIFGEDLVARYFAEEHALFEVESRFPAQPGDHVRLICGYAPTTVNLHDVIFIARDERVVDVWPVFPRGPHHHGFLRSLEALMN
ncbi:alanine racemase [uncultured Microbacterium sp.]|uniref:alanine racemase n=1 Tax=uncultured Microbacterium sp. TaxID=191216 RepID=UPI0035C94F7B